LRGGEVGVRRRPRHETALCHADIRPVQREHQHELRPVGSAQHRAPAQVAEELDDVPFDLLGEPAVLVSGNVVQVGVDVVRGAPAVTGSWAANSRPSQRPGLTITVACQVAPLSCQASVSAVYVA
jgi:hypothetical protein